uniref:Muscarinic acetylcholine receptor n=1 Tax=Phasianus colchicus TaxID=9054 RepID=A0A669QWB0_PHACC
ACPAPSAGPRYPRPSTPRFSLGVSVLLALLMVLLALVTVFGNVLVILAFILDRNLRHRSNYFFLNLAISDFAVGVFCMPLYIPYALTGTWHLGKGLCKLWLLMDYLVCSASVFNIVLISYDRFLSVTKAVSYRAQQGMMSSPVVKMVAIWILAFLLYSPAVLLWEYMTGFKSRRRHILVLILLIFRFFLFMLVHSRLNTVWNEINNKVLLDALLDLWA